MRMTPVAGTRFTGEWQRDLLVPYLQHMAAEFLGVRAALAWRESGDELSLIGEWDEGDASLTARLRHEPMPTQSGEQWVVESDGQSLGGYAKVEGEGWMKIELGVSFESLSGKESYAHG